MSKQVEIFPQESKHFKFRLQSETDDEDTVTAQEFEQTKPILIKRAKWNNQTIDQVQNNDTLLQYDPPFLTKVSQDSPKNNNISFKGTPKMQSEFNYMEKHHKVKCTGRSFSELQVEQLLDLIRLPYEFQQENGEMWKQRISKVPVTCSNMDLENKVDELLKKCRAGTTGTCPLRQQVYDDCFDEILRQIALDTPEKAILLLRCRRELEHRIQVYSHLFGGDEAYIMRQTVLKNDSKANIQKQVQVFEEEIRQMSLINKSLTTQFESEQTRQEEKQNKMNEKYSTELGFLRNTNLRLRTLVDTFKDPSKMYTNIVRIAVAKKAQPEAKLEGRFEGKPGEPEKQEQATTDLEI